ncbi:hypothetical protein TW95_gp0450 [Pandoravirus inopinatum]|uniref:Uncharacterized protein n=1 Tax=Pandoravirus inopinatum TaxID=1605721 RepID=A0A0B5J161_9VIRU|nr:hypothetical protein TW95_gp0450 [Pandoravirus inopinatum]AJF97184.1 hypothetical protein [Pandoravirus inopinatum]
MRRRHGLALLSKKAKHWQQPFRMQAAATNPSAGSIFLSPIGLCRRLSARFSFFFSCVCSFSLLGKKRKRQNIFFKCPGRHAKKKPTTRDKKDMGKKGLCGEKKKKSGEAGDLQVDNLPKVVGVGGA